MATTTPGQFETIETVEVRSEVDTRMGSRIRGGPVWGGFAVGLALWILLELLLFAVDLAGVDVGVGDAEANSWFWNGIAAVLAFFVGGMVAGMASPSRRADTGAIDGIVVWAIGLIATFLLTGLVGGVGFGALGDVFGFEQALRAEGGARIAEDTLDDFREAAAWAAGFAALTLAAAAGGGMVGAKLWPRREVLARIDVR